MPKYIVAVPYTAECCANAHVWTEIIEADTPRQARKKVMRKITRREYFLNTDDPGVVLTARGAVKFVNGLK